MKTVPGISFGPFFLDTAGRRLLREGRRVPVSPIELKLLETLLRNRERVLTGDELRILVWADDPATEIAPAGDVNALYVAIRKLRRSLGDHGKWIVNIPKVGYTLSEEVSVREVTAEPPASKDHRPFVGRQSELANLKELLSQTRLVTLTGPPGIGKSRLASKLAAEVSANYPDGVHSVNFVPIESETLVPKAVLTALGLAEQAERTVIEEVAEYLKDKRTLLVFDNCEHVIDACSELADHLLRIAPNVQVIAASREPLLISGEAVVPVPPLSVPDAGSGEVGEYDAVKLFVTLAKQHQPGFECENNDAAVVGELCRQLEGIPLAIELAAVQVGAYTVEQIVEVMADRFRLLRRRGGEDSRHQTLEGAVDWSHSLLTENERILLRRLSAFSGGWTGETAKNVCSGDGLKEQDVVYLLAQLVRRSLIHLDSGKGTHRYQMLETIRQFSRQRLREAGEEDAVVHRHSRYFLDLAERAFEAGERGEWPARLEAEYDNIRAVLQRTVGEGSDIETGLRMCGALARFWFNHGHIREARWWTKRALDADDGKFPAARARALLTAGFFFGQMAGSGEDSKLARRYFEEGLSIWRQLGEKRSEALLLSSYAFFLNRLGAFDEAEQAARESLAIFAAADDQANIARSANNLALTLLDVGRLAESEPIFKQALAAARAAEDKYLEAVCLHNLGDTAVQAGELEQADEYLAESLKLFSSMGHRPLVARTLLLQGEAAALKGEYSDALKSQKIALRDFREMGDNQGIASALEAIACTFAETGTAPEVFLTLNSAADALRQKINLRLGPGRKIQFDRCAESAASAAGPKTARSAIEKGRTMTLTEAVEFALAANCE